MIHRRRDAGLRAGIADELAILRDRPDMHAPVRRVVNGEREQRRVLARLEACNDLHGNLLVRARRIELRRHAVMSCGPSHLARRANWSPCGAPTTDLPLPRRVLFHTSFTELATAAG